MKGSLKSPMVVIQNCTEWVKLTENWIYTQVCHLPDSILPFIVCDRSSNLDQFKVSNLVSFADMALLQKTKMLIAGAAILGVDTGRMRSLLAFVAKKQKASLVHSHFGFRGYGFAKAVKKLGIGHVVSFYGVDATGLPKEEPEWIERYKLMFQLVDRVLCEGPFMARTIMSLGCPAEKIQVIHLGVRVRELAFVPRRWTKGEPLRVLIAASFREKKGIPYALDALGRLQTEIPLSITIIGDSGQDAASQREKEKILSIIGRNQLGSKVKLMGFQPFSVLLEEAYRSHVFLSPSVTASNGDTEGGAPVGLIEMAATGMPVVSSVHCDIPEVIENGVTGLLAEEKDVEGLENHLRWLVENPYRWDGMARAAREKVEKEFNAERQGERLAAIYYDIAEGVTCQMPGHR